jgi:hypothetical protein
MLKLDPAERFLIDDVLDSPAIRSAPELASGIPEVPLVEMKEGETIKVEIDVCPEGFSFAGIERKKTITLAAGDRSQSDGMIASIPRSPSGWDGHRLSRRSLGT